VSTKTEKIGYEYCPVGQDNDSGEYICVTKFISSQDSVSDIFYEANRNTQQSLANCNNHLESNSTGDSLSKNSFKEMELEISQKDQLDSSNTANLTMSGLHTCGDLASVSLQLYQKDANINLFAGVGCCYHLLTEKKPLQTSVNTDYQDNLELTLEENFQRLDFDSSIEGDESDDSCPVSAGFPLSQKLKCSSFSLGRNARMIAAQSPARLSIGEVTYWLSLDFLCIILIPS